MSKKSIKHAALLSLVVSSFAAVAGDLACTPSGTTEGSVMSVKSGGEIVYPGGTCKSRFYGIDAINIASDKLKFPESNDAFACKTGGNTPDDRVATATTVQATNKNAAARTLPAFPTISVSATSLSANASTIANSSLPLKVAAGEYNEIASDNGRILEFTGPARIKRLTCNSSGGITFAAGDYFIENFSQQAGCNLRIAKVNGVAEGKVTLNIKNSLYLNAQSCINYEPCTNPLPSASSVASAEQLAAWKAMRPDLFQINVYTGNVDIQAAMAVAAGIYVDNGNLNIGTGGSTFVGELVANNIYPQNNPVNFIYVSTGGPAIQNLVGNSTIAPPAYPAYGKVGDLVYVASQWIDNDKKYAGHLRAYRLGTGAILESAPSWDAVTKDTFQNDQVRRNGLWTNTVADDPLSLVKIDGNAAISNVVKTYLISPLSYTGDYGMRNTSAWMGRPWRSGPIIAGKQVLFSADDGLLYAVDKSTGDLKWAWMPKDMLTYLDTSANSLSAKHPWGQIQYVELKENGATNAYVLGTALDGTLHFSLKLKDETTTTDSGGTITTVINKVPDRLVWYHLQNPGVSPTVGNAMPMVGLSEEVVDNQVGAAPGGQAPIVSLTNSASAYGTSAYILNNNLYIRKISTTGFINNGLDLLSANADGSAVKPSSNLVYWTANQLVFGDDAGNIKLIDLAATNDRGVVTPTVSTLRQITIVGGASKILGITATNKRLDKVPSGELYLLVYTKSSISSVRVYKGADGAWTADEFWYTSATASTSGVPRTNANAIFTGLGSILAGRATAPYTVPPSAAGGDCVPTSYLIGPLDIKTGQLFTTGVKYNSESLTVANNRIGSGESLMVISMIFQGASPNGIQVGTSQVASDRKPDQGVIDLGAFLANATRLQWRELTNY